MGNVQQSAHNWPISWDQINRDIRALAWRLEEAGTWKNIIVASRGGLIPAAFFGRYFNICMIDTLCIDTSTVDFDGEFKLLKAPKGDGGDSLLVSDIVENAKLASMIRRAQPKAHFAAIIIKPPARPFVDTFLTELPENVSVIFPWST